MKSQRLLIKNLFFGCFIFITLIGCNTVIEEEIVELQRDTIDRIEILEVSPTAGLVDGDIMNFNVTVEYNLASRPSGILIIGFNTHNPLEMRIVNEANRLVSLGNGQHTFDVNIQVVDWESEADFIVYVNLSEFPLTPGRFTPLSNDTFTLIRKQ